MIRRKRLLLNLLLLLVATLTCYEILAWKAAAQYRPVLEFRTREQGQALSWSSFPLPCYYEVEVLACKADSNAAVPFWQRIDRFQTNFTEYTLPANYPFQTFWRVSAHSPLQSPLGKFSQTKPLGEAIKPVATPPLRPQAISHYPSSAPATSQPFLTWTKVTGAVYYELELLSAVPEHEGVEPSRHRLSATREVFANGYNVDLSQRTERVLYWRVRALDFIGNPIGIFSEAERMVIDPQKKEPLRPKPTALYNQNNMPTPLYPVYYWIPVTGASAYEVEITNKPPENPGGVIPSVHRIWSKVATGYGYYDETARSQPGSYYWRVRALDTQGRPLGVYSDAIPFKVDLTAGNAVATFGDSITHGGGAVSYSPADWEYSYQTYLKFPYVNLGKSGDTSSTMVERFERDVLPYKPRNLLIMGGTNSLRGGIPADKVIADLTILRQQCLRYGIRPIFLTLPPINPIAIEKVFQEPTASNWRTAFDQVNQFIRQQHYYIDLEPYFLDENRELPTHLSVDGLHIDIEGKRLMGNVINHFWESVAN